MIRTLRTRLGDSRKPPSRSARLTLLTLEDHTVRAWLIHLPSGAGMAGDNGRDHHGRSLGEQRPADQRRR